MPRYVALTPCQVDIPGHGDFPSTAFVIKNFDKKSTMKEAKADMKFRHKGIDDKEWGKIYTSVSYSVPID